MNQDLVLWLKDYAQLIKENKDLLNELDTPIGDGDHGTNMDRGMSAVIEVLEQETFDSNEALLKKVGMTLLSKVGGASGPLYGSAFIAMAKVIDQSLSNDVLTAGYESISKRGKSELNEKTMLDVWIPLSKSDLNKLTKEEIHTLSDRTKDTKATKGRASFLGERSIGYIDPGSLSSALLFEAALKVGVLHG